MDIFPTFRPRPGLLSRAALWAAANVLVAALLLLASEKGALDGLRDLSLWAAGPLATPLRDLGDWGADVARALLRRPEVIRENKDLRQEVERLRAQLAAEADARQRLRELELILGLRSQGQESLLAAKVVAVHFGPLAQAIAIDRGAEDGLAEGMAVLSPQGSLVGTVSRLFPHHAWVTLVTDPRTAVNVAVQIPGGEEVRGVLLGRLGQSPVVDMLPQGASLAPGQLVVTSGLGGKFPPGILVGTVAEVDADPQHPSARAVLEPAADVEGLHAVAVLTSFRPMELGQP